MPDLIRHPDVVPTKVGNHLILGSGFHREPWIPAFAGMTLFIKTLVYGQTQSKFS